MTDRRFICAAVTFEHRRPRPPSWRCQADHIHWRPDILSKYLGGDGWARAGQPPWGANAGKRKKKCGGYISSASMAASGGWSRLVAAAHSLLLVEVGDVTLFGPLHDDLRDAGGDARGEKWSVSRARALHRRKWIVGAQRARGIFKFDAPGSSPGTWCGCAGPRPGACLRWVRRIMGC